MFEVDA